MIFSGETTIIALSTPYQISAIHVLRISGTLAIPFLRKVCSLGEDSQPRRVYFRNLIDPDDGRLVDEALCFFFLAPKSYTGEDLVEIHTHGSVLIVDKILAIAKKYGIVLAKPGEFTERAFLNGKIDIDQAQAVDALVRSKQSYLMDNALKILTKKESFRFKEMKNEFIKLSAKVEAMIEFPSDDLEGQTLNTYDSLRRLIEQMINSLEKLVKNYRFAKKRENGIHIVILGEPNVGKSTFLNFLLGKRRSIVSSEAGTTRDYIKEQYKSSHNESFWFYDTAGIRDSEDKIEQEGVSLSLDLVREADFLLALFDERLNEIWLNKIDFPKEKTMVYLNKSELLEEGKAEFFGAAYRSYAVFRHFSLMDGLGNGDLKKKIEEDLSDLVKKHYSIEESQLSLINDRQLDIVSDILLKFENIELYIKRGVEAAFLLGELHEISLLLGELFFESVEKEEIFDNLFRSFCIGK